MTTKWDELIEWAQQTCDEAIAWQTLDNLFRALLAKGIEFLPESIMDTIRDWTQDGTEDQPDGEPVTIQAGRVTTYMTLGDLRALSAGSIKPEGI